MSQLIEALAAALGAEAVLCGEAALQVRNAAEARGLGTALGAPLAVLRPRSTAEVSRVLALANAAAQAVVPWGGCTGLVDGAYAEGALALSLDRLCAIEQIDEANRVMRVQAGCILQSACEAAEAHDLLLPLDLGARGSATIGGTISTNAGGNRVLRWGMTRDMVLGLTAVLADGTVIDTPNTLIKNNAGYDLKQLFIGSEGTLGVVTRAVLRLRPKPLSESVALLAVEAFEHMPRLLRRLERGLGGSLSSFEVMWAEFYRLVTTAPAPGRPILPHGSAFYVLVEARGADVQADADHFEKVLAGALEAGEVCDAVIAKSDAERRAMWSLRDDVAQVTRDGPVSAFDVSLKIDDMPGYLEEVRGALVSRWGGACRLVAWGHLGDGNLHLMVSVGEDSPQRRHAIEEIIYGALRKRCGSSISGEHGIGLQKRAHLSCSRTPGEIALMRTLKTALDPRNILNPGKVLAATA
jgi:FAD/FMN-containing dehydrogenase